MNLHPDKQPQNYDLSKKLFQDIDEAYKQISTPLRRYLYR
jgi:DnaJ-class molecular chaperone